MPRTRKMNQPALINFTCHPLHLRPVTDQDLDILRTIYASTREDEMRMTGWNADEIRNFLTMQFNTQHRYYQSTYANDSFQLIMVGDAVAGRLYLGRWPEEIRIIDITLLPAFRGQGIGHRLLHDVQLEATAKHLQISIHVEKNNPAQRLYARCGFMITADAGVYWRMDWHPPAA